MDALRLLDDAERLSHLILRIAFEYLSSRCLGIYVYMYIYIYVYMYIRLESIAILVQDGFLVRGLAA